MCSPGYSPPAAADVTDTTDEVSVRAADSVVLVPAAQMPAMDESEVTVWAARTALPLAETDTAGEFWLAAGFTRLKENTYMVPAAIVCPAATVSTSVPGTCVHAAVAPNTVVDPLPPTSAMLRVPESAVCVPVSPLIITVEEAAPVRPTLVAKDTVIVLVAPP
jgi:hypothetical protein